MLRTLQHSISIKTTNVSIQPVRWKAVINTIKPRNDHFWAKKMKILYKPKKPRPFDFDFPMAYKCRKHFTEALRKLEYEAEENPYERILANEIKEGLLQSKMILLIHRNPVGGYDCFEATKKFVKSGMNIITHGRKTVKMAVEDTKLENIMTLFHTGSTTWLITCPEVKLNLALSLLKKMPFHILMAGIVEDRFLYRHQLEKYGEAMNIDEVRAQLLSTLNTPATQLVQNLTQHQRTTVTYLDEYVKMKSTGEKSVKLTPNIEPVDGTVKPDEEK